jgi:hypothetical protein
MSHGVLYYGCIALAVAFVSALTKIAITRRRNAASAAPAPSAYADQSGPPHSGFSPQPGASGFPPAPGYPPQPADAGTGGFPTAHGFPPHSAGTGTGGFPTAPAFPSHSAGTGTGGFPAAPGFPPQPAGAGQQSGHSALSAQAGTSGSPSGLGFPPQPAGPGQQGGYPTPSGFPQPPPFAPPAGVGHPTGLPQPAGGRQPTGSVQPTGFLQPAGSPQPAAFPQPAGSPVSPAAGAEGFQSAAALFAPPKQPAQPQPSIADPGTYGVMPSGLAGHDGPEQALPSGRPSGLSSATPAPFAAPAPAGTRPSGLPRREPSHADPQPAAAQPGFDPRPAHVEFTQRLVMPEPAPMRDEPAGPQPIYPGHTAPASIATGQPQFEQAPPRRFDSAPTQQFTQGPAPQFNSGAAQQFAQGPADHYRHAETQQFAHRSAEQAPRTWPTQDEQQFGPADNGHQRHAEQQMSFGHHAAPEEHPATGYEQTGRHGYHDQAAYGQPTGGHHWRQEPEAFEQPAYRPTHGEQNAGDEVYGSPSYPQAPGRHEQPEPHPADWPPFRR